MKKKKLLITSCAIALLGTGLYFGIAKALPPIASRIIRANGFPKAWAEGVTFTPTGMMIEHVSLDGDDFSTVDTILIGVNWLDFIQHRTIDSVTIKDISLTAEIDTLGNLKIAGWDATLPQSQSTSALLPINSLLLQGVTVDLDTPQGDIRVEGKLSLETPNSSQQTIQYALWGQQHQLSFDTKGSGTLAANGDISLTTTLNEGRVNLPNMELSRASGWIKVQKSATGPVSIYSGELNAGRINTYGALLQNVALTLDTTKQEALSFTTSPSGFKDVIISGRWVGGNSGQLKLNVKSKQSLDIVSLLAPDKVDAYKSLLSKMNPLDVSLSAPIDALKSESKKADFEIALGDKNSQMQIQTSGALTYNMPSGALSVALNKSMLGVAKGQIDIDAFPLKFTAENVLQPFTTQLTIHNMDMTQLSKLADVQGLKVDGLLDGSLPLSYTEKGFILGQSSLTSLKGGTFQYTPKEFPPSLQGDDERMKTVRDALSDFRFTKLKIDMSGAFDDKMKTTLSAEGKNPQLGDRPIQLNLNLDGDLGAVMKQILQIGAIDDQIRAESH